MCRGANPKILVYATHPIFSGESLDRLRELHTKGSIDRVVATDSIVVPDLFKIANPWFEQVSIAPLIGQVIYRINHNLSVSELYGPRSQRPTK